MIRELKEDYNKLLGQKKEKEEELRAELEAVNRRLKAALAETQGQKDLDQETERQLARIPKLEAKNQKLGTALKEIKAQLAEIVSPSYPPYSTQNPDELRENMSRLEKSEKILYNLIAQFENAEVRPISAAYVTRRAC